MKKTKRIAVMLMAALMICTVAVSLVACHKTRNPEKTPFSMSISTPDGVFNPFFSTSAYDSSIIGLTQISMLSTGVKGEIVCGENEPTVVKDYTVTENKDAEGKKTLTTTYEFLIKKGIKWSNGFDLTIKDVLFNLYVYLDPAYTGSATIYSTDIVGLQNYRTQIQGDISNEQLANFESQFLTKATERVQDLITYIGIKGYFDGRPEDKPTEEDLAWGDAFADKEKVAIEDIAVIAREFYSELVSDWNAINVEDYKDWQGFKEVWQIFMLNDGGMTEFLKKKPDGTYDKDANQNYKLDTEEANKFYNNNILPYLQERHNKDGLNLNPTDKKGKDALNAAIRDCCVGIAFEAYFPEFPMDIVKKTGDKFKLEGTEWDKMRTAITLITYSQFRQVINGRSWNTTETMFDKFTKEAKSDYFAGSTRQVPNISGITTRKTANFKGTELGSEFDVLTIEVNEVDPKAIYNFAFTVAPMYYYSGTWDGKNYIKAASDGFENKSDLKPQTEFGLEFGSAKFMNEVINAPSKIRLPMGAGPYMASTANGKPATSGDQFFNMNMVYYERNPYFETVGEQLENAKIKYLRYKVVESDQIINALINGDIDYGDPSATQDNLSAVKRAGLENGMVSTNGYGYVGINPRFVPEVNVRRAIMLAMKTQLIFDGYYKGGIAEEINRHMSINNWAYPKDIPVYSSKGMIGTAVSYAYDELGEKIDMLLSEAGYNRGSDGVMQKTIAGFGVDKLDYKFTIAGGSTDHPAYAMFLNAKTILNEHGFDIKVVTSQTALTDLSAGKLEVWAAAWSSTIDPDMYQVYHMESQASSVKNWGYAQIIGGTAPAAWGDELIIVTELSDLIDKGRQTTDQDERIEIYGEALDLIMELACEFHTYQRNDMFAFQKNLLDLSTLPDWTKSGPDAEVSPFSGVLARIWEISYRA